MITESLFFKVFIFNISEFFKKFLFIYIYSPPAIERQIGRFSSTLVCPFGALTVMPSIDDVSSCQWF